MRSILQYSLFAFLLVSGFAACKKWDDHIKVEQPDLNTNLLDAVAAQADLSKFRSYISKVGLDTLLQSSKNFTVWAPSDNALQNIDPALVADTAKLRAFVLNHISDLSYFTRNVPSGVRVRMLNGKYNTFAGNKFEEAGITTADKSVRNGVLHVIDKPVPVLQNIWEFITGSTAQYNQNRFVAALNFNSFDPNLAIVDSISALTGLPVYRPGTGIVVRNRFNDQVYDLRNEEKQYTYFLINNAGYQVEVDSLKTYYKAATTSGTDTLAQWNVVKDLLVEGNYPANTLPPTLLSKFGVAVPTNSTLVETKKFSNGTVYVFNTVNVLTANKFREYRIEGENPSGYFSDRRGNVNFRVRNNPVTGQNFSDIMISGHGVTAYYSFYRLNEVPSMKFRVFAFGVNDFQAGTFSQSIVAKSFVSPATYTTLATLNHAVPLRTAAGAYNEMFLGEFTTTSYGTLELQLTSSGTNPVVLDYVRLVPVL